MRNDPKKFADQNENILQPGVYKGFHVHTDGSIDPGVLLTKEAVRIEETATQTLSPPDGHESYDRFDAVVCRHEYEPTVPPPVALFEIIEGTPDEPPELPSVPSDCILLAYAKMNAGETGEWDEVVNADKPGYGVNVEFDGAVARIIDGSKAAFWMRFHSDYEQAVLQIVPAGTLSDGDQMEGGSGHQITIPASSGLAAYLKIDDAAGYFMSGNVEGALAELKGMITVLADALTAHEDDEEAAHPASAIGFLDELEQFEAEDIEAALVELMGKFLVGHDAALGYHKTVYFNGTEVEGKQLILRRVTGGGLGGGTDLNFYADDDNGSWLTHNAFWTGLRWEKGLPGESASLLRITGDRIAFGHVSADVDDWDNESWSYLFQMDVSTGLSWAGAIKRSEKKFVTRAFSAPAFSPEVVLGTPQWNYVTGGDDPDHWLSGESGTRLSMPISLPPGAVLKQVKVFGNPNGSTVTVAILRQNLASNDYTELAAKTGDGSEHDDITIGESTDPFTETIQADKAYTLTASSNGAVATITGALITYQIDDPLS